MHDSKLPTLGELLSVAPDDAMRSGKRLALTDLLAENRVREESFRTLLPSGYDVDDVLENESLVIHESSSLFQIAGTYRFRMAR